MSLLKARQRCVVSQFVARDDATAELPIIVGVGWFQATIRMGWWLEEVYLGF